MYDYVYIVYHKGTGRYAIYKDFNAVLEAFKHVTPKGRRQYAIERKTNPMDLNAWMSQYAEMEG